MTDYIDLSNTVLSGGVSLGGRIPLVSTVNPHIMRPVFGSMGTQHVRFYVHQEFSEAKSKETGMEERRPIEICEIQNDRFSRVPIRIKDMTAQQRVELAPLYERFKTQKDSKDTAVVDWEASSDMEKGFLMQAGVFSVEQLANFDENNIYKLGAGGVDLRERARRHVATKKSKETPDHSNELKLLREEKEALALRLKKLEEAYFDKEAKKAKKVTVTEGKKEDEAISA